MKQVFRENRSGKVWIEDVPPPSLRDRGILVQNLFSVISIGTEGASLKLAKSSILEKAKKRPEDLKKIKELVKNEGLISTYKKVKDKLEVPTPPGYSCAGKVIGIGKGVEGFSLGDLVACGGGGYAFHGEIIWVPKNLCVKVPQNVLSEHAAFTTIGAIAIQGLRQAEIQFGEKIIIIGLGLVGQLAVQVAKAAGVGIIAVDIDPRKVELARQCGADVGIVRSENNIEERILAYSDGYGIDAALITASTTSNDPIILASKILRDRGRITIVGAVPMNLERKPFYSKELSLNISRSYGPGRYDGKYEEDGFDYPIGYVRWTENRNMKAFIDILAGGKLDIDRIITHRFNFEEAPQVYDRLIKNKEELIVGTVFEYPVIKEPDGGRIELVSRSIATNHHDGILNVGFIGAGNYAQNYLLPILSENSDVEFRGVATTTGSSSSYVGKKYGFKYITTDPYEIINDDKTNLIFIVTRHNTHADFAVAALNAGKHVFLEKPLAINQEQLEAVIDAVKKNNGQIMVGFNRRFSPLINHMKNFIKNRKNPVAINYRINAGFLDRSHWVQDPEVGGGRIIGEMCHFLDLCSYLTGSTPHTIYSQSIKSQREDITCHDTNMTTISYVDGSIATVQYLSNGDKSFPKERIELFSEGSIAVIDDFRELSIISKGKVKRIKPHKKDKGQSSELNLFIEAIRNGDQSPIRFHELVQSTILTFKVQESLLNGMPVEIEELQ